MDRPPDPLRWLDRAIPQDGRPFYLALADAIAASIEDGILAPGAKLPAHRAMAQRLGVAIATVTRAYAEAEKRGLVEGHVGRGTFIGRRVDQSPQLAGPAPAPVDLAIHRVPVAAAGPALRPLLEELAAAASAEELLGTHPNIGAARHREGAAAWLAGAGIAPRPEQVIVCNGGQHAMLIMLAALLDRSGVVATEALTDPSLKAVTTLMGRRLVGVPMDAEGLRPEALAALCRRTPVALLVLTPNLHNPTNATLPAERREAVVAIARRHDIPILESDIYGGLLAARPPPLAALAPERVVFVSSLAKLVGPGIKVGYMAAPAARMPALAAALRLSTWMAAPLSAEVAHRWIADPARFAAMLAAQRAAAAMRAALARRLLGPAAVVHAASWHAWLPLPEPWQAEEAVREAAARGIRIAPLSAFTAGRDPPPHAIRLCLGIEDAAALRGALAGVAEMLRQPPGLPDVL